MVTTPEGLRKLIEAELAHGKSVAQGVQFSLD